MHGRALALTALACAVLAGAACAGCERKEPPAPLSAAGTSSTAAVVSATASGASASAGPSAGSNGSNGGSGAGGAAGDDAGADASSASDDAAVPELLAPDGGTLPQTQDMPSIESATYKVRLAHLWRAIVEDKPELADDAFFPLVAYGQVKAVAKPEVDYERRLVAAFHRDLHAYHRKLGPKPEEAKFVELAVPTAKAHWVKPGEEYNKLGYNRVFNSKLRFQRADGKEGSLLVLSMISWRGEWYVVHVAGIK
jgi:hypothetical protein